MSTTLNKKDGVHLWLITTGMPSAGRCFKASKEKIGKKCFPYKEMNTTVGVKKPQEDLKAKDLWAMKVAKDRREYFYDPARKDNIFRRNKTRLELWEEHLQDPIVALDKAFKCVEVNY